MFFIEMSSITGACRDMPKEIPGRIFYLLRFPSVGGGGGIRNLCSCPAPRMQHLFHFHTMPLCILKGNSTQKVSICPFLFSGSDSRNNLTEVHSPPCLLISLLLLPTPYQHK
ncbi:hypothetical protein XELAEV_18044145mg [Xenopus laevis]|uniref:Uncharacterized protein n=1 Tax=Xenopus laevis TaxID=8355 RepID=A0A974H3J2_XENLA|nr:hypothetical protein XELAEV_18044145mg [Xenopus laevis]